ncbi:MAG: hypothetical protein ABIG89_04335 [Candidatus Woesearchaeota archaeon]
MVDYFIEVTPKDKFRIEILTAQKTLLTCLKRCEMFKQVREEKLREIDKLRTILKYAITTNNNLKLLLPKVKIKLEQKEVKRKEEPKTFYDYSKQLTELESSIGNIEKKLRELGGQ